MRNLNTPYPYPGLRPFKRKEASIFFGRQEQANEILNKLKTNKFLSVLGSSGSGKSSLIKAGVLPSLAKGYMGELGTKWQIVEMRPGSYPFYNLAKALSFNADEEDQLGYLHPSILAAELRQSSNSLKLFFENSGFNEDTRMLVLVDQFEELFRYEQQDSNLAAAFVALILEAAKHESIYIIITMRSDFLGNAGVFLGLPEAINEGMYLTPRLNREQLHDAICLPAQLCGGEVDPILANHIINEAANSPDHLPLLQHALRRLWVNDEDKTLTFEEYQRTGGLHSILNDHLDSIYNSFNDEEQLIAKRLFGLITERTLEGKYIRRAIKVEEVLKLTELSEEKVFRVINTFRKDGHNFLMPSTKVDLYPELVIDITHESLIRQWNRLGRWINQESENGEHYKSILEKSERHNQGKGDLLSGIDLEQAKHWVNKYQPNEKWASRYGGSFDETYNFFDSSLAEYHKKKKKKLFRNLGLGLFSSLLIGSFSGYVYNSELKNEAVNLKVKVFESEARLKQEAIQAELEKKAAASLAQETKFKQEAFQRRLELDAAQAKARQAEEEKKATAALAREATLKQEAIQRKLELETEKTKVRNAEDQKRLAERKARDEKFKQIAIQRELELEAAQAKARQAEEEIKATASLAREEKLKQEAIQRKLELETAQAKARQAEEEIKATESLAREEKLKQEAIQRKLELDAAQAKAKQAEDEKKVTAALAREANLRQEAIQRKLELETAQAKARQVEEQIKATESLAREEKLKQEAIQRKLELDAAQAKAKQAEDEKLVTAALAREAILKQEAIQNQLELETEKAKVRKAEQQQKIADAYIREESLRQDAIQRELELETARAQQLEQRAKVKKLQLDSANAQIEIAEAKTKREKALAVIAKQNLERESIRAKAKQERQAKIEASTLLSSFNAQEGNYSAARTLIAKIDSQIETESFDNKIKLRLNLLKGQINANSLAPKNYKKSTVSLHDVVYDHKRDILLSAGEEGKLSIYEPGIAKPIALETNLDKSIQDIAYHPGGDYFVTVGANARILLWQWTDNQALPSIIDSVQTRGAIKAVAFSPDGNTIVTGHSGSPNRVPIRVWKFFEKDKKIILRNKILRINKQVSEGGLVFLNDGRLAGISHGGLLRIWNTQLTKPEKTIEFQGRLLLGIDLSSDGSRLAVSDNRKITVLDSQTFEKVSEFVTDHSANITTLKWVINEAGKELLVSGDFDGRVFVWDVEQGVRILSLAGHESGLGTSGMAYDSKSHTLYIPDGTGVMEWKISNPAQKVIAIGPEKPRPIAFSQSRDHVLIGTDSGNLNVYESTNWQITDTIAIGNNRITDLALQPDGSQIAVASRHLDPNKKLSGKLSFYSVNENGKLNLERESIEFDRRLESLAFNIDGTLLYTSGLDGRIGVIDMSDKASQISLSKPISNDENDLQVRSVNVSEDGKYIITSRKRKVQLWRVGGHDLPIFPPISSFESSSDLHKVMFSGDSKNEFGILTVGRAGKVLHYPIDRDDKIVVTEAANFFGHKNTVYDAEAIPEADMVVTLSADATIRGWALSSDNLTFGAPVFTLRLPSHVGYPAPVYDFDLYCTETKCRIAAPLRRKAESTERHMVIYDFNLTP